MPKMPMPKPSAPTPTPRPAPAPAHMPQYDDKGCGPILTAFVLTLLFALGSGILIAANGGFGF